MRAGATTTTGPYCRDLLSNHIHTHISPLPPTAPSASRIHIFIYISLIQKFSHVPDTSPSASKCVRAPARVCVCERCERALEEKSSWRNKGVRAAVPVMVV